MHEIKIETIVELSDILTQLVDTTQGVRYSLSMLYENLQGIDNPEVVQARSILYMLCQTILSIEDKIDKADDLIDCAKDAIQTDAKGGYNL